jgi:hypothetical protein
MTPSLKTMIATAVCGIVILGAAGPAEAVKFSLQGKAQAKAQAKTQASSKGIFSGFIPVYSKDFGKNPGCACSCCVAQKRLDPEVG